MSIVSTRFALKEKRKGKITKNGLTHSSSTPSNPYGSKAEACQPETMISAPCQGHGDDLSPRTPASETGAMMDRLSDFPNSLYKRRRRIFILFFL